MANYEPLIASDKERSFYTPVKDSADAYSKQLDLLEPLMRQGDIAAAVSLVSTGIRPLTNTMEVQIKDLTNFNNQGAAQAGQTATDLYNNGLWLVVGLIAGVVVLTVGLALLLTKVLLLRLTMLWLSQNVSQRVISPRRYWSAALMRPGDC